MRKAFERIHEFIVQDPTVRAAASDPVAGTVNSYAFGMSTIPFLQQLCGVFEYYKLVGVDVVYKPFVTQVNTPYDATLAPTFVVPDLAYAWTKYSNVPTSYSLINQRGSAVIKSTMERWTSSFRPVPLMRGYQDLVSDGFLNLGPQWISTDQQDVPHYGLLLAMEPSVGVTPVEFGGRITFHYRVQFKNPRSTVGTELTDKGFDRISAIVHPETKEELPEE